MENVSLNVFDEKLVRRVAKLYCQIWQEPPWNEFFWTVERVIADLRKELALPNAVGFVCLNTIETIGFSWGYGVNQKQLEEISGSNILDFLFEGQNKVFYIDELGIEKSYRQKGLGRQLTSAVIQQAKLFGTNRITLRTETEALAARQLYSSLGFKDLNLHDVNYPNRTYWLLETLKKIRISAGDNRRIIL